MSRVEVEAATEKHELPEAPISITVKALYKGFEVLITRRSDEKSVIPQIPGFVALIDKLVEMSLERCRGFVQLGKVKQETNETENGGAYMCSPPQPFGLERREQ